MSIVTEMKKERMKAMKSGDKVRRNTLTVFLGDIETDEKRGVNVDDTQVIQRLKKSIQHCKENYELTNEEIHLEESRILDEFLPKQMSEKELKGVIQEISSETGSSNIGVIMKELKSRYTGLYDGKMASKIIKDIMQ